MTSTVIFACVHNAGRSQMAAAFFNALADAKRARAVSAGTEPGPRVHPEVMTAMKEVGIDLSTAKPQRLTRELATGAKLLVTMGCGESCPVVPGARREDWPLEDPKGKPVERVREIRDDIRRRIEAIIAHEGWGPARGIPHEGLNHELCAREGARLLGSYAPLTFTIEIGSSVVLGPEDPTTPPSEADLTVLHEHDHLVQDTTTLHGLLSFGRFLHMLTSLARHNASASEVTIPIDPTGLGTAESSSWYYWKSDVEGTARPLPSIGETAFDALRGYSIGSYSTAQRGVLRMNRDVPVHACDVVVEQGGREYRVSLGAYSICEGLAEMLCDELAERAEPPIRRGGKTPPFPYEFVPLLAKHIAKKRGVVKPSRKTLATFADRALGTLSPGYFMSKYLEAYCDATKRDAHVICDDVEQREGWDSKVELQRALAEFESLTKNLNVQGLRRLFDWLTDYIGAGIRIRLADRDAFLGPFLQSDAWAAAKARVDARPVPLLVDRSRRLAGMCEQIGVDLARFFQGLRFAASVLTAPGANRACPAHDSCGLALRGEACLTSPWDLLKLHGDRCAIGSAFAALGMDAKQVKLA